MLTKLLTMLGLVVGPQTIELPLGAVYIPPATSGKGVKVVKKEPTVILPKVLFPNPLDKKPIIEPPEFFFAPIEVDINVTQVTDTFSIPDSKLDKPVVISAP